MMNLYSIKDSIELNHSLAHPHLQVAGGHTGVKKDSATNLARAFSYSDSQTFKFTGRRSI